jgi:hypothetical protein
MAYSKDPLYLRKLSELGPVCDHCEGWDAETRLARANTRFEKELELASKQVASCTGVSLVSSSNGGAD